MIRALYSVLMMLAQPLLRRKLARRAVREPLYAQAVPERFGHYDSAPWPDDGQTLWVHAVSLGEVRAATILLAELRPRLPGMRLLLTHGTATGREAGQALLRDGDAQAWLPWDTPDAVQRFLRQFRPRLGVLMETEVWPNLVVACAGARVPLLLANARLSEKSLQQALRLAWLARQAYGALHAVWAQTEDDARRLRQLNAPVQGVLGNLKFDATPDACLLARGRALHTAMQRPVVLLASSRDGEEALLLQVLQENSVFPQHSRDELASKNRANQSHASTRIQWLIVPRHPQRFDEVEALLRAQGLSVSRRSTWPVAETSDLGSPSLPSASGAGAAIPQPPEADVWLGDTLGEMPMYYGMADVALLGGSFARLGGQNLIEAAACGCPVVLGPYTYNFAQASELALQAGAAQRAVDVAQGVEQALALVADPAAQARAAQAASAFAQAHRGAARRLTQAVVDLLETTSPAAR